MLRINRLFSDHMVLQREKEIHIWGTCTRNGEIFAELAGNRIKARRTGSRWMVDIPPMKVQEGLKLLIECGEERIEVSDICIGEVWVAAGQSNMEFYMRYDADCKKEKAKCDNPRVRFFDVPETCYIGQEKDYDFSRMGFWRKCTSENLDYFSAAAYYFAAKICEDMNVPVGIIGCNRGASTAAAWIGKDALKEHGQVWLDEYEQVEENGKDLELFRNSPDADTGNPFADPVQEELLYGISHEKQLKIIDSMPKEIQEYRPAFNNRPGCLYESMLRQIIPCTVRGILWYQGESDVQHPNVYKDIFKDLIRFWREQWKEELPFCCVQLPPFEEWLTCVGDDFPIIRQAQKDVSDTVEKVFLVSISDSGMKYDIHPKKKKPVGERLALCAEKHVYGMHVPADAPSVKSACLKDGTIMIHFSGDGEKLVLRGEELKALRIFRNSVGKMQEIPYRKDQIYIEGKTLVIPIEEADENEKLRLEFACSGYFEMNLFSDTGLPAMPFAIWTDV